MVGIKTDVGNIRILNEDYAEFFEQDEFKIYVVADGMGGHNAGEIASKTAVKSLIKYIKDNFKLDDHKDLLSRAINHANLKVNNLAHCNNGRYNGMGTTLVATFITKSVVQVANVGDSSCVAIKDGAVFKITKDHSLVQELLDSGSISETQALKHPKRNIITRAIGTQDKVKVDIFDLTNQNIEFFIMCTDGLTNEIDLRENLPLNITEEDLQDISSMLVEKAKLKGGRDNITVMVLKGGREDDWN